MKDLMAVLFAVLLSALLYVGNFSWWLDTRIVEPDDFSDATAIALNLETSREAMGELITDRLVDEFPLLVVLESNLVSLFSELLATPALEEVLAFVALEIHNRIVTGSDDPIVINLESYREVILAPIDAVAPRLTTLVPDDWFTSVTVLEESSVPDLSRESPWVGWVKVLSILGAIGVTFLLLRFVKQRGMGITLVGMACLLAGLATAVLVPGAKILALAQTTNRSVEVIISNVYNQFTAHLKVSALVLALVGVAFVAIGVATWASTDQRNQADAER